MDDIPTSGQEANYPDVAAIIRLLSRRRERVQLTPEEQEALAAWRRQSVVNARLMDELQDETSQREALLLLHGFATNGHMDRIIGPARSRKKAFSSVWVGAAAALVCLLSVAYFLWLDRPYRTERPALVADVQPGGKRATLTLADGRMVDLDAEKDGIVVNDVITYLDGSSVLGEMVAQDIDGAWQDRAGVLPKPLKLATPKGGTYQVTLPDGSRVWLNANSALVYPSRFSQGERIVRLSGEAYFEIREWVNESASASRRDTTANARKVPFRVITDDQIVEVLGTTFNIAAYEDEPETVTTLVKGSVRVHNASQGEAEGVGKRGHMLVPGQRAVTRGRIIEVEDADAEASTAWVTGSFSFDGKGYGQIIRELARWYDLEVRYEGSVPDLAFFGSAYRDERLSVLLRMLGNEDVAYRLNGQELIIMNKRNE